MVITKGVYRHETKNENNGRIDCWPAIIGRLFCWKRESRSSIVINWAIRSAAIRSADSPGWIKQDVDFDLEAALAEIDLADYPDSTPEAFEKFKEYLMQAGPEEAKLILEDKAMIQMMVMDNYWE